MSLKASLSSSSSSLLQLSTSAEEMSSVITDFSESLLEGIVPEHQEVTHEQYLQRVSGATLLPSGSTNNNNNNNSSRTSNNNNNVAQRMISSIIKRNNGRKQQEEEEQQTTNSSTAMDCISVCTAQSLEGMQSIAAFTVGSCETAKASNRTTTTTRSGASSYCESTTTTDSDNNNNKPSSSSQRKWKNKIKSLVTGGTNNNSSNSKSLIAPEDNSGRRQRLFSSDTNKTRSPSSSPCNSPRPITTTSSTSCSNDSRKKLDQSIRCRMDGLDVLSIGPARSVSLDPEEANEPDLLLPFHRAQQRSFASSSSSSSVASASAASTSTRMKEKTPLPWGDDFPYTFTGQSLKHTPAEMVSNMLWTNCDSATEQLPVIILEGFVPGSDDRWRVPIEEVQTPPSINNNNNASSSSSTTIQCPSILSRAGSCGGGSAAGTTCTATTASTGGSPSSLAPADTHDDYCETSITDDGGSLILPSHRLWPKLWGTINEVPSHSITADLEWMEDDDPLLHLAAQHSIPIDLDENTFCISERGHMETIHNFVAVSLAAGRFRTAIFIFTKLLKGIDSSDDDSLRFLKGAALHNIGLLYLWQGQFELAVENFHLAVQERTKFLPKDHPDIAVSMVQKGVAQFALGRLDDALFVMELAVEMLGRAPVDDEIARSKILNNMGVIHYQQRKFPSALKDFTLALEIQKRYLDGPLRRDAIVYDAATTLGNMGKIYLQQADYKQAYYVYEEALLLQTTMFRKDHELVLASLQSLAITRVLGSQTKKALQILQGCLRSQNTRYGKESQESVETVAIIGFLYGKLQCYDDAIKCFLTVRKWQKACPNIIPSDHPSVQKIKSSMNEMEELLGRKVSVWL